MKNVLGAMIYWLKLFKDKEQPLTFLQECFFQPAFNEFMRLVWDVQGKIIRSFCNLDFFHYFDLDATAKLGHFASKMQFSTKILSLAESPDSVATKVDLF